MASLNKTMASINKTMASLNKTMASLNTITINQDIDSTANIYPVLNLFIHNEMIYLMSAKIEDYLNLFL
jgi:hypothetical protein